MKGVCGSSNIIRELSAHVTLENKQDVVLLCVYGRRELTSFCCFSPFGSMGLNNVMLHLFDPVLCVLPGCICLLHLVYYILF